MENATHKEKSEYDRLKSVAELWMERVWQQRDLAAMDQLHAVEFKDRSPAGRLSTKEAYQAGVADLFTAFPDFHTTTEDVIVDASSGKVAIRWTATGTHQGTFLDVSPTGRRITFRGIEIIRIKSGQIVERWGEWDGIDLLAQLGAVSGSDERLA
jgi:steroid delta-isomerase-like uncharacterized protein